MAGEYNQYIKEYGAKRSNPTPEDRRYLDVHEGHFVYLKPGEERFVSSEMVARTLTGTPAQVNERLDQLESIGVNNVALSAVDRESAKDLIRDFGEGVIRRR